MRARAMTGSVYNLIRRSAGSIAMIIIAWALNGCGSQCGRLTGTWVSPGDPSDRVVITRNGNQFLLNAGGSSLGAVCKDGSLEVSAFLGAVRLTHVRKTDTLIAPGLFGESAYVRENSKAARDALAARQRQEELRRQREAREKEEYERQQAARQAKYERERAQREATEQSRRLYKLGFEALNRKAYDDALPPLLKAAERDYPAALNALGWFFATTPDPGRQDGAKAVQYALAAVRLEPERWNHLGTLGAAYARAGDFPKAMEYQQRAIDLLRENYQLSSSARERSLEAAKARMALYSSRQPYSEDP